MLSALVTGVAPERQKIMVKGGVLKDDQEWGKAGIKPGAKLMMIGTADAVPQAPTAQQARNVYDLSYVGIRLHRRGNLTGAKLLKMGTAHVVGSSADKFCCRASSRPPTAEQHCLQRGSQLGELSAGLCGGPARG